MEGLSSGLEASIEMFRQQLLGMKGWKIQDHYQVVGRFTLAPDFRQRYRRITLSFAAGNLLIPNYAVVRINELPVEVRVDAAHSQRTMFDWKSPLEYIVEIEAPLEALRPGENQVEVRSRMMPGLGSLGGETDIGSVHNMSLDSMTLTLTAAGRAPG